MSDPGEPFAALLADMAPASIWSTGGGCWAVGLLLSEDPSGPYMLATDYLDGCSLPASEDGPWLLGVYAETVDTVSDADHGPLDRAGLVAMVREYRRGLRP